MSQCPGCKLSFCLSCEKEVDPRVFRCEPCRVEYDKSDPFAKAAAKSDALADKWMRAALASRACLEYMSQDLKSKKEGDEIAEEFNEAWKEAFDG